MCWALAGRRAKAGAGPSTSGCSAPRSGDLASPQQGEPPRPNFEPSPSDPASASGGILCPANTIESTSPADSRSVDGIRYATARAQGPWHTARHAGAARDENGPSDGDGAAVGVRGAVNTAHGRPPAPRL